MLNLMLTGNVLKGLIETASKEETRYYLNGVAVSTFEQAGLNRVVLTSTDGHIMTVFKTDFMSSFEIPNPVILHTDDIKTALGLNRKKNAEFYVEISADSKAGDEYKIGTADRMITARFIDGTYPDFWRVIPHQFDHEDGPISQLNPSVLERSAKALRLCADVRKDYATLLVHNGKGGPCAHVINGYPHILGVVMPVRGDAAVQAVSETWSNFGRPATIGKPEEPEAEKAAA